MFEYNEADPASHAEYLLIIVEDQFGNTYQEEFQIAINEQGSNSTGIYPAGKGLVHIYPNPANDYFVIPESSGPVHSYRVVDITGKQVMNHPEPVLPGKQHTISDLHPGIYFILMNGREGTTRTGKLVVQD